MIQRKGNKLYFKNEFCQVEQCHDKIGAQLPCSERMQKPEAKQFSVLKGKIKTFAKGVSVKQSD